MLFRSCYAEKIREIFERYRRSVCFRERKEINSLETVFSSIQLFKFIDKNFGRYSYGKKIPEWVKFLPANLKKELVRGYLNGDGSIFVENTKGNYATCFVSVSQQLLEGVQDILFSLGLVFHLNVLREAKEAYLIDRDKISKIKKTFQLRCAHHESIKFMNEFGIDYDKTKESKVRKSIGHNFISDDLENIYLRINEVRVEDFNGDVYNFETESHSYLCNYLTTHNCDVSSGTSSDTSTIEVLDTTTMEQVAEFKGFISTPMFARLVKDIARIYNDAFVVIECNSIGDTIFSNVYYSENDPYGNVYKQKRTRNGITRFTGWITDVSTRKLMVKEFIDWVAVPELFEQFKINSSRLYNEMETWIWVGVDKAMHANNCHDDAIMAMALALKLRDKAQLQESSMFIAEDGTVITYDREATMERAREEVVSFSSVDGSGKKKVNIKGGNSAGIMSSNSDEFGGTALERKIKKEYNVNSIDELRWLLGG